jgi:hypothetical protein
MAYAPVPTSFQQPITTAYRYVNPVTPATGVPFPWGIARALYIGGAGNVTLCPLDSATVVTFSGLAAGTILPVMCQGVDATSTATLIIALG